jgi:hypothetical protein
MTFGSCWIDSDRTIQQELLVGSERLVTPLEWGNTRQTFQGVHALWSNGTLDFDGWWTEFVPPNPSGWSSPDLAPYRRRRRRRP